MVAYHNATYTTKESNRPLCTMTIKVICFVAFSCIIFPQAKAQIGLGTVSTDLKGRVVTTYKLIDPDGNQIQTYLGSPYLGDHVWHPGALIYRDQQQRPGQIAYNLILNQIQYRSTDSSTAITALPDEFIVEGERFVSAPLKGLGANQLTYFQVLYGGKTTLLRRYRKRFMLLDRNSYGVKTAYDDMFNGQYVASQELFILKKGDEPQLVALTVKSITKALKGLDPILAKQLDSSPLTEDTLIYILNEYDRSTK